MARKEAVFAYYSPIRGGGFSEIFSKGGSHSRTSSKLVISLSALEGVIVNDALKYFEEGAPEGFFLTGVYLGRHQFKKNLSGRISH